MKLGVSYQVFDGEELLEFAVKSIRLEADHITVVYQTTSYFGNPSDPELPNIVNQIKSLGLIDELIHYEPNLSLHHKQNELIIRNLGLEASRKAGCTHHISADVDEMVIPEQLAYTKKEMEKDNYDFSVATYAIYYKDPTWLVTPSQNLQTTFIHPVDNEYTMRDDFVFPIEYTRKFIRQEKYRVFSPEEILIHHMCYVRKDIYKKYKNSDNGRFHRKNFYKTYENYQLGGLIALLPDFLNRRTTKVENIFGINL